MTIEPDAWRQAHELHQRFTTKVDVRADLRVMAHACDRTVSFGLGYERTDFGGWRFHTTKRNVGTMRELANALLDACDFVEESNPEWTEAGVQW